MADWLDYSLADFLLFSPAAYSRLFEQLNSAVWPLHIPLLIALCAIIVAAAKAWRRAGLAVGLSLALCWTLTTWLFLSTYYAPINWAIGWVIPFAWLQAGLLALLAGGLHLSRRSWLSVTLIVLALAYPALGMLVGRPAVQAEVAGLAPDPTALLTLGLVGFERSGWRRAMLGILPAVWLMVSALTLFALGSLLAWILMPASCLVAMQEAWRQLRKRRRVRT